jgi:hypothetical protein
MYFFKKIKTPYILKHIGSCIQRQVAFCMPKRKMKARCSVHTPYI